MRTASRRAYAVNGFAGEGFAAGTIGLARDANPYSRHVEENRRSMTDSDLAFWRSAALRWESGWNMSRPAGGR